MRIKVGSRVSTEAWRFDNKNVELEERWSFTQFGEQYLDARCYGTVIGKKGEKWNVEWKIDKSEMAFESRYLQWEVDEEQVILIRIYLS